MNFILSIFAGIFIGIGSNIYLRLGNVVGAILFSIGLLSILLLKLKLFTGTVGYIESINDIKNNMIILCGNIVGAMLLLLYPSQTAIDIVTAKVGHELIITFVNAVICGMLIYVAVEAWRNKQEWIVPFAVAGFIMFGAEHSIADICFIMASHMFNARILVFILVVVLGNAVGAITLHRFGRN